MLVRSGQRMTRFNLFGEKQGMVAHVKRAIKLTPLSAFIGAKKDAFLESALATGTRPDDG
jgi:hypothetical protein